MLFRFSLLFDHFADVKSHSNNNNNNNSFNNIIVQVQQKKHIAWLMDGIIFAYKTLMLLLANVFL